MNKRIQELREQINEVLKRWPAHTPSPALVQQLDDLEEELAQELQKAHKGDSSQIQLTPIGYVENAFDTSTAPETIRQSESAIILSPHLVEGLMSLEESQQIMVVFYFHKSQGFMLHQHPRGDSTNPKRGVFALRSPNRPNPIGVTIVDLITIEGNILRVRGLDALNGTPVLDLKPA